MSKYFAFPLLLFSLTLHAGEDYFHLEYNSDEGRGKVVLAYPDGMRAVFCLSCGYHEYAGGVYLGNYGRAGIELYPSKKDKPLRAFCAQDETIFVHDGFDYDFGWSKHSNPGNRRALIMTQSGVLENNASRILLYSLYQKDCLSVIKLASMRKNSRHIMISSSIMNRCDAPITFDFVTGDDPFIGKPQQKSPDMGWYNGGHVLDEKVISGKDFRFGGLFDQNVGIASLIMPDRSPDDVFFANSFALLPVSQTAPKSLKAEILSAMSLIWRNIKLEPRGKWTLTYAIGWLPVGEEPQVEKADWNLWADHARDIPKQRKSRPGIEFEEEEVTLTIEPDMLKVRGVYAFTNTAPSGTTIKAIIYPFPVNEYISYPHQIEVKDTFFKRAKDSILFSIRLNAGETKEVIIEYKQALKGNRAKYITRTARRWGKPISKARFIVKYPRCMKGVKTNFLQSHMIFDSENIKLEYNFEDYAPEKDLVVTWDDHLLCDSPEQTRPWASGHKPENPMEGSTSDEPITAHSSPR